MLGKTSRVEEYAPNPQRFTDDDLQSLNMFKEQKYRVAIQRRISIMRSRRAAQREESHGTIVFQNFRNFSRTLNLKHRQTSKIADLLPKTKQVDDFVCFATTDSESDNEDNIGNRIPACRKRRKGVDDSVLTDGAPIRLNEDGKTNFKK